MDKSSLIVVVIPIVTLIALFTAVVLHFIAGRKGQPPNPASNDAGDVEYLYVPCVRVRYHGYSAETHRWVQEVPIVKKTAQRIYYTGDSWDRRAAVVSPGCISREQFENDTRCHGNCPAGARGVRRAKHDGYPAGVIPVPGDSHRPGPAGRLFFATRQAAEEHLHRGERERAGQAAPDAPLIKKLRSAMADAHPDRGGTTEQFIQARRRYQAALRTAA